MLQRRPSTKDKAKQLFRAYDELKIRFDAMSADKMKLEEGGQLALALDICRSTHSSGGDRAAAA